VIAIFCPGANGFGALNGSPNDLFVAAVCGLLYGYNTTTSTGLLAVNVTTPDQILPSCLGGAAKASWC
jgi:hypothetical protein